MLVGGGLTGSTGSETHPRSACVEGVNGSGRRLTRQARVIASAQAYRSGCFNCHISSGVCLHSRRRCSRCGRIRRIRCSVAQTLAQALQQVLALRPAEALQPLVREAQVLQLGLREVSLLSVAVYRCTRSSLCCGQGLRVPLLLASLMRLAPGSCALRVVRSSVLRRFALVPHLWRVDRWGRVRDPALRVGCVMRQTIHLIMRGAALFIGVFRRRTRLCSSAALLESILCLPACVEPPITRDGIAIDG
jgi:hypothetical protein